MSIRQQFGRSILAADYKTDGAVIRTIYPVAATGELIDGTSDRAIATRGDGKR